MAILIFISGCDPPNSSTLRKKSCKSQTQHEITSQVYHLQSSAICSSVIFPYFQRPMLTELVYLQYCFFVKSGSVLLSIHELLPLQHIQLNNYCNIHTSVPISILVLPLLQHYFLQFIQLWQYFLDKASYAGAIGGTLL